MQDIDKRKVRLIWQRARTNSEVQMVVDRDADWPSLAPEVGSREWNLFEVRPYFTLIQDKKED
jgi:hypothetical protein